MCVTVIILFSVGLPSRSLEHCAHSLNCISLWSARSWNADAPVRFALCSVSANLAAFESRGSIALGEQSLRYRALSGCSIVSIGSRGMSWMDQQAAGQHRDEQDTNNGKQDGGSGPKDAEGSGVGDEKLLSWGQAVFLMTSDTVGLGLLLLPYAYSRLGYKWGTVVMGLFVMASSFNLHAMYVVKHKICPEARSLSDAAQAIGGARAAAVVGCIVEANWVLGIMFVLSAAVQAAVNINSIVVYLFYPGGTEMPSYVWSFVISVFMLPMAQIKSLSGASWFGLASTAALVFALGISYFCFAVGDIAEAPLAADGVQEPVHPILEAFNGWVGLVLVLQIIFVLVDTSLEVMSDMKDSTQFESAQVVSHAFAGTICLGLSAGALHMLGPDNVAPYILMSIHPSWQAILAEAAVAFKAAVTYVIVAIIMLTGWYGRARMWAAENATPKTHHNANAQHDMESPLPMPVIEEDDPRASPANSTASQVAITVSNTDEPQNGSCSQPSDCREGINPDKGVRAWIARVVNEDKNLTAIWFVTSTALVTFTAVVVATFPYIDLIGAFLSALTGAPLVFGLPYYLLIWGSRQTGLKLNGLEAVICRAFLYVLVPIMFGVGIAVTVMETLERFGVMRI